MTEIVNDKKIKQVIDHPELDIHKGKFITIYPDVCLAVDNSSGEAHHKKFLSLGNAVAWLCGNPAVAEVKS